MKVWGRTTHSSGQILAPSLTLGRCGLPLNSGVRPRGQEGITKNMRKKQIIVQFKTDNPAEDIVWFQDVELILDGALRRNRSGIVDGNDIGSGTMNIFIWTDSWRRALEVILAHLRHRKIESTAVVAKREPNDTYRMLWPLSHDGEFHI